jgi:kynurenine formamidase
LKPVIYLSYPLDVSSPSYGNGNTLRLESGNSIARGDSCNTSIWHLPNHLGTHIDFPHHFVQRGKTVTDYNPKFWFFNSPCILDISPVSPGKIIGPDDINFKKIRNDVDLLIVKTGFCEFRKDNIYWENNPGFDPNLAALFRLQFPLLRIIGFDLISLSSFSNRAIGRKAHNHFLNHKNPILLLEDMDLTLVNGNTVLPEVVISPLIVQGTDGSPCTVFATIL